ncbi:restriction endonuclease subunit S [Staphylococcus hominis]|uniref:restriction endonuclease subunit S n=1 Tax=Staphylococcus hominis TaxID=1290 RepID=UPI00115F6CEA|nr:restriction endonuclease subunit S [Staphylococcus hominis]TRL63313.1 restriction endonuclease subunit S [Staphylococcus hominis]
MEFKRYRIEEIGTVVGGGTPSTKNSNYYGGNIPWITPKDLANYEKRYIQYGERNITDEGLKHSSAKLVPANTILMTSRAPIGYLAIAANEVSTNQGFKSIICDEKVVSPKFLYYLLQYEMENIKSLGTGSTFSEISGRVVKNIEVNLPNIENQKKIEGVLDAVDEKIETNQHIIANLEELSQTLFKHWFVDFEFPDENGAPYKANGGEMIDSELGKIPKGWIVKSLDEIANYINGLAMQKYPSNKVESLPIVKIKELKNGFTDENSNRCTTEIPEKAKIDNGDIIFSWSATLLVKMWAGGKAGLNQHLFKVTSETFPKWFYYLWTKRYIEYFINIANDKATTMGHINRKHLSHAKIVLPTQLQLENFDKIFHNLLEKQLNTEEEIKRLIELRDTLLPKLMSGEIEIPDDIEVNSDELSI